MCCIFSEYLSWEYLWRAASVSPYSHNPKRFFHIHLETLFNSIRPRSLRHTLTRVVLIWLEVHKWETVQHIFSKVLYRCSEAFQYIFESKVNKKYYKVPPQLNINWGVHIKFSLFLGILIQFANAYFDSDLANLTQSPYIKNWSTHFPKTFDTCLQPS